MNECHKLICCSRWFLLLFLFFIIVPIGKSVGRLVGRWMVIQKLFPNLSEKHIQRMVQILFIDRLFGIRSFNFRNIFALLSHFKFQNKIKLFLIVFWFKYTPVKKEILIYTTLYFVYATYCCNKLCSLLDFILLASFSIMF